MRNRDTDFGLDDAVKGLSSDFNVGEPSVVRAALKINADIRFAAAGHAEISQ